MYNYLQIVSVSLAELVDAEALKAFILSMYGFKSLNSHIKILLPIKFQISKPRGT